jgi:hypothetical protein
LAKCRPAIFIQQLSATRSQYDRIANAGIGPVTHDETIDVHPQMSFIGFEITETVYLRKKIPGWIPRNLTHTTAKAKPNRNKPY